MRAFSKRSSRHFERNWSEARSWQIEAGGDAELRGIIQARLRTPLILAYRRQHLADDNENHEEGFGILALLETRPAAENVPTRCSSPVAS